MDVLLRVDEATVQIELKKKTQQLSIYPVQACTIRKQLLRYGKQLYLYFLLQQHVPVHT